MSSILKPHRRAALSGSGAACAASLAIGVAVTCSSAAPAAEYIRYVSITGNNANDCTLTSPCRTLQRGINRTPPGGELRILDSGPYGDSATVGRSITISGGGHTVLLGVPLNVDAADAIVRLRGLTLDGRGTTTDGIRVIAAAKVSIERCTIRGHVQYGILAVAPDVVMSVTDSLSRDNGYDGLRILNAPASRLTIDNSRFENAGSVGIRVDSGHVMINRSTATGNGASGIFIVDASVNVMSSVMAQNGANGFSVSGSGTLTIESSVSAGNVSVGLAVFSGSIARVSNSTINDNGTGIFNNGTIETRQNNTVRGNGNNVTGTLTQIGGS